MYEELIRRYTRLCVATSESIRLSKHGAGSSCEEAGLERMEAEVALTEAKNNADQTTLAKFNAYVGENPLPSFA